MTCLVTGCAGFIGSHLCERLLALGHRVIGIDCFSAYYARSIKEQNLAGIRHHRRFQFHELDLSSDSLSGILGRTELVFHMAGMPGLARSWTEVDLYTQHNLTATHRLLEAVRGRPLKKFVFASTSSVYGRYANGDEALSTKPSSPYGITKLAAEQLARVYLDEYQVPTIVLRYFSVYGPRQRPDMGYYLFIQSILNNQPIRLYGDGLQIRGNTFVDDCIEATLRAALAAPAGEFYNVGGGELTTILAVVRKIENLTGRTARIEYQPPRKGDQLTTGADAAKLARHLDWKPATCLDDGLARQIAWQDALHTEPRIATRRRRTRAVA